LVFEGVSTVSCVAVALVVEGVTVAFCALVVSFVVFSELVLQAIDKHTIKLRKNRVMVAVYWFIIGKIS